MKDYTEYISRYLRLEIEVLEKLDKAAVNGVMNLFEDARVKGADIYICGNGGSASTASHFTSDFNRLTPGGNRYRFVCLNDSVPAMLAIANDYSYEQIFTRQLEGRIAEGDVLVCLSGSGNSKNILSAARYAKESGAVVVGLTGYDGGELRKLADYCLHVPVHNMQIAEDVHLIFDHMIVWILANMDAARDEGGKACDYEQSRQPNGSVNVCDYGQSCQPNGSINVCDYGQSCQPNGSIKI